MNRLEKVSVATAVAVTLLEVAGFQGPVYRYYSDQMSAGGRPIYYLGLAVAAYGPLVITVSLWRLSGHVRPPWSWLMHALFFPAALLSLRRGEQIMLSVVQDPDFDVMFGGAVLPATLSFLIAGLTYAACLLARAGRSRSNTRP